MVFTLTPSDGKTSITDLVKAILKQYKKAVITYNSLKVFVRFNSEVTIADLEEKLPCKAVVKDN